MLQATSVRFRLPAKRPRHPARPIAAAAGTIRPGSRGGRAGEPAGVAIFHLSAHERVSRSAGQSSVASAAYVMRAQFTDERTGQHYDFRHLDAPQWIGMFSPKDAPDWTRDAANAERFWNALELFEKRKDAQIALPLDIALPFEMTLQQNIWLAQDYIREHFTRQGYVVLAAIHPPDHDERNIHLHLLVSLRKIDATVSRAPKPNSRTITATATPTSKICGRSGSTLPTATLSATASMPGSTAGHCKSRASSAPAEASRPDQIGRGVPRTRPRGPRGGRSRNQTATGADHRLGRQAHRARTTGGAGEALRNRSTESRTDGR